MSANPEASSAKATKGPSDRQRNILDAYHANPSAAAVARAHKTHERHVRRLVKDFAPYLEELRRARHAARLERESARLAMTQEWLDATYPADLQRLDELTRSDTDGIALRALQVKFDLSKRAFAYTSIEMPAPADTALIALDRSLEGEFERLSAVVEGERGQEDG